jgi:hypothetical protein
MTSDDKKPSVAFWATVGLMFVACAAPGIVCQDAFVSLTLSKVAYLALGIMAFAR